MDERTTRAYPTDRRAASPKRQSDVIDSEWPLTTLSAYQGAPAAEGDPTANRKMNRLCFGRIRIGHALLALDGAILDWKDNDKVYDRLRTIRDHIEKEFLRYPLEVRNK